jgi:hypothetical protein
MAVGDLGSSLRVLLSFLSPTISKVNDLNGARRYGMDELFWDKNQSLM